MSGAGTIKRVPISGGTVTILASGLTGPRRLAVDNTDVYWTELGSNIVNKISKTANNGTPTILASGLVGPLGIAVDNSYVYFTEYAGANTGSGSIIKVLKTGGGQTTLVSGLHGPRGITVDGNNVYFTEVADSKQGTGMVKSVPLSGGSVTLLASGLNDPTFPDLDSSSIYWAEQGTASQGFTDGLLKKIDIPQTPTTGSINGTVKTASGSVVSGLLIILNGTSQNTTTDSSGAYNFSNLPPGTYTVTPTSSGCFVFTPFNQTVTIPPDASSIDFIATPICSISGTVTNVTGSPMSGVSITITGSSFGGAALTDNNGNYSFSGLHNDSYSISASQTGYTFSPSTINVTVSPNSTGQNFLGSVSGLPDLVVTFLNAPSLSAMAPK